jgi:hypothetical protein
MAIQVANQGDVTANVKQNRNFLFCRKVAQERAGMLTQSAAREYHQVESRFNT